MADTGGGGGAGLKRRRIQLDPDDEDEQLPPPPPPMPGSPDVMEEDNRRRDDSDVEEEVIEEEGQVDRGGNDTDRDDVISEDEGEDLMENLEADYVAIPELDTYDMREVDTREYAPISFDARRAAEEELDERYQHRGRLDDILDRYGDEDEEARDRRRGHFDTRRQLEEEDEKEEVEDEEVNLEAFDVPLREWIAEDRTRREVKRRFRKFLLEFKDASGRVVHLDAIQAMCAANLASLEVNYQHLSATFPILAFWLADAPTDMLEIFDEVANEVVLRQFPYYRGILQDDVHVRMTGVVIVDQLRSLRQVHLNSLIRVIGVVTRRTQVFPQLQAVTFDCQICKRSVGPFKQTDGAEITPASCPHCHRNGPFRINQAETTYRNYQKITLQESPGTVPAGRVPRYKEVILTADLIDRARPGEEIDVTGVYMHRAEASLNQKHGFPVFSTCILANCIQKREDQYSMYHITDDDKAEIHKLAQDPNIARRLMKSFAPSIHGHEHVKRALLLALFGGMEKCNNKERVRGDINCLLLGDPGTAKSQFLKYLEKVAPRAIYTTGKGASAVGLTAGVHKDPLTKEWTLEGGALVLADRGMCLIDEFDKMNDADRTSIHESLEQQTISVSKAGIVATLQARCSVVAAANPIGGRYDSSLTLPENVELTDPILQRLDILCVLQDIVDPLADERLALFIVGSHQKSHPERDNTEAGVEESKENGGDGVEGPLDEDGVDDPEVIPQKLLTKYITYARANVRPQIHDIDQSKIEHFYQDLRRESTQCGGIPVAVRHLNSIIRMSEAHAKMHMRDHVRDDDVNVAISVMLHSFLQAQKFSVRTSLERGFRKYISQSSDYNELLMSELHKLMKDAETYARLRRAGPIDELQVFVEDLEARARELKIYDLSDFFRSDLFRKNHMSVQMRPVGRQGEARTIVKTF